MPLPLSLILVLSGLVFGVLHRQVDVILAYVVIGLALANEALRAATTRAAGSLPPGQYEIPPRERTPITFGDSDAS